MFLVRHPEALKNIESRFAGSRLTDSLTEIGRLQTKELAAGLSSLISVDSRAEVEIIAADSLRAMPCAQAVSEHLGLSFRVDPRLVSISGGIIAGQTEADVRQQMPSYHRRLETYRRGLLNSYDLGHPGEDLRDFEARVQASLSDIAGRPSRLNIVVAHKSALTAALIHYSRRYHGYPHDFFGFVDLPLASISLVRINGDDGEVVYAGRSMREVLTDADQGSR